MDRISGANYITVGGKRMWRDRNLAANQEGTFGNALWFDGTQESILFAVELAGLVPTDSDNTQMTYGLLQLARRKSFNIVTAPGTSTWACPANVYTVWAFGTGGGGAGSAGDGTHDGAGGGAGGTFIGQYTVVPGTNYTLTVGAGGTAVVTLNAAQNGATTSFAAFASATGGVGGGWDGGAVNSAGGAPGTPVGGLINLIGGVGGDGQAGTARQFTGNGGASFWGGGGRAGTNGGTLGQAPGSGGGGAYLSAAAGGNGAPGILILVW